MSSTIAFLFDSTAPELGGVYGDACIGAAVRAVLDGAAFTPVHARVKVGDVPLHALAERTVSFAAGNVKKRGKARRTSQHTVSADRNLLSAILWDLVDNVEGQWHTVELESVLTLLVQNGLFSVTFVHIPTDVAIAADQLLRVAPGYSGAVEVDLGNPVQWRAFVLYLIDEAVIEGRSVTVRSEDDEEMIAPNWTSSPAFDTVTTVADWDLKALAPHAEPLPLSASGTRTAQLVSAHSEVTPASRLLDHLVLAGEAIEEQGFSQVRLSIPSDPDLRVAIVPEKKLVGYALDPAHSNGKHKAELFRRLLGIEAKDWRYLAAQLLRGLASAVIKRVRLSPYGVKYSADIPVIGLNGETKVVTTGWIAIDDQPAQLTTAMIAERGVEVQAEPTAPPVIVGNARPEDLAEAVFEVALREAQARAASAIPVPMKIQGFGVERDGACGFAGVHLPDGRSSFVRWLRKHGVGRPHHKRGWYIPADTGSQSLERNRAFATAFAEVLILNGIEADVEWRLD